MRGPLPIFFFSNAAVPILHTLRHMIVGVRIALAAALFGCASQNTELSRKYGNEGNPRLKTSQAPPAEVVVQVSRDEAPATPRALRIPSGLVTDPCPLSHAELYHLPITLHLRKEKDAWFIDLPANVMNVLSRTPEKREYSGRLVFEERVPECALQRAIPLKVRIGERALKKGRGRIMRSAG